MLGKLMKYEWKATWKLLLSANLVIVVMTFAAWIMTNLVEYSATDFQMIDFVEIMVILTYVISMFAVYVGTSIFLIYRFYTSTYGDQGYLLHTLPVDTHHIILAKVSVSALWLLINSVMITGSVLFLFTAREDAFFTMMEGMADVIELMSGEEITLFTIIMTLVAYVFSLFAKVLKVGACISLGQLSSNHKLMLSFAWYVGIYLVECVCSGVYFSIRLAFQEYSNSYMSFASYYDTQWETTLLAGILGCVIYYILTWYVMGRKLNLD